MAKVTLNDVSSLLGNPSSAQTLLNSNNAAIEAAFENTISRDGTEPNQMEADFDMDSNRILNVGDPEAELDAVNLRSVRPLVEQFAAEIAETIVFSSEIVDTFETVVPLEDQFLLSESPVLLNNTWVFVDGVYQRPGVDYTLSGVDLRTLEFFTGLPAGVVVSARYGRALPTGLTDAANISYTPPSTGVLGPLKTFLDDLWTATTDKGAALLRFIQNGVGAIARNVMEKLAEEVSVTDFMTSAEKADIRLVTPLLDHTAAIQAALDSFITDGYGRLRFPKGRYNVSAELLVSFNGEIFGDGVATTFIRATTADINIFNIEYSGYINIHDIEFGATVTKTLGAAVKVDGLGGSSGQQTRIHHCKIMDQFYGIDMNNAGYWTISENYIGESVQAGIRVDNTQNYDAGDNLILANVIQKTLLTAGTAGILHVASGGTKVIGNKILGHDRGYALTPRVGALSIIDTQLVGNSIEDGNTGIYISTPVAGTVVGQMTIVGNQMSNKTNGIVLFGAMAGITVGLNQIAANFVNHVSIYIDALNGNPANIVVANNQISGNSSAGSIGIFGGFLPHISMHGNDFSGVVSPYSNIGAARITDADFTFANLPAAENGSIVYCSDGTIANPVAGGGTGCIAKRINSVWVGN